MKSKFTQIAQDFENGKLSGSDTWQVCTRDIARITNSRNTMASKILALEAKIAAMEIEKLNKPNRFAIYG